MNTKAPKFHFCKLSLLAGFIVLFLSNCSFISYEEKPLASLAVIEKITEKDTNDPSFSAFLKNQGVKDDQLPLKEWGLKELLLCALFFNPKIEIAKKEWDIAKVQEIVAPIKAPSSIEIGRAHV